MDNSTPISTHPRFKDLTGMKFNRLTVIRYAGRRKRDSTWECICDCGIRKTISRGALTHKRGTISCGCIKKEKIIHGHARRGKPSSEFISWGQMIQRCTNPNNKKYPSYGGRGILIAPRYLIFQNFLNDIGPKPGPEYSIDRINNNGNYEPGNIRWATPKEQMRNLRKNVIITFRGESRTLPEWAEIVGIASNTIRARLLSYGWPAEKALTQPVRKYKTPNAEIPSTVQVD